MIKLNRETIEEVLKRARHAKMFNGIFDNDALVRQWGDHDVDPTEFKEDELNLVLEVAKDRGERTVVTALTALIKARHEVDSFKIKGRKMLRNLPDLITEFLARDAIDGWVYLNEDDFYSPWLTTRVRFHDASERYGPQFVSLSLSKVGSGKKSDQGSDGRLDRSIRFGHEDLVGTTVAEMMISKGLVHETPELKASYERDLARFLEYLPQRGGKDGGQFVYGGPDVDLRPAKNSERWGAKKISGRSFRFVNDEDANNRGALNQVSHSILNDRKKREDDEGHGKYRTLPLELSIYGFDLSTHEHVWVHASSMRPYVYDHTLRDKIVLPQTHRDLIEVLVEEMDVLMDDVISGKSGGTTILCQGMPGLGKTLTAQVYCEHIGRPLYAVNAGQLGTSAEAVEENLEMILKRSERWGAVLLLDEADVYIRKRGDDLEQSAIVAAFLRTVEYFGGIFFMTTNRGDEVDDAILSRCIARITYDFPDRGGLVQIWKILSRQFEIELGDELIEELADAWPRTSGRDVKELLKLTSKYVKSRNKKFCMESFRAMAQFRGML
jgi:hypothetical protein